MTTAHATHATPASAAPGGSMSAPKTFDDLPLAASALSIEERAQWINVLDPLLMYAGRPGDWGRNSKLGLLTMRLLQVREELVQDTNKQGDSQ